MQPAFVSGSSRARIASLFFGVHSSGTKIWAWRRLARARATEPSSSSASGGDNARRSVEGGEATFPHPTEARGVGEWVGGTSRGRMRVRRGGARHQPKKQGLACGGGGDEGGRDIKRHKWGARPKEADENGTRMEREWGDDALARRGWKRQKKGAGVGGNKGRERRRRGAGTNRWDVLSIFVLCFRRGWGGWQTLRKAAAGEMWHQKSAQWSADIFPVSSAGQQRSRSEQRRGGILCAFAMRAACWDFRRAVVVVFPELGLWGRGAGAGLGGRGAGAAVVKFSRPCSGGCGQILSPVLWRLWSNSLARALALAHSRSIASLWSSSAIGA